MTTGAVSACYAFRARSRVEFPACGGLEAGAASSSGAVEFDGTYSGSIFWGAIDASIGIAVRVVDPLALSFRAEGALSPFPHAFNADNNAAGDSFEVWKMSQAGLRVFGGIEGRFGK